MKKEREILTSSRTGTNAESVGSSGLLECGPSLIGSLLLSLPFPVSSLSLFL